MKNSEIIKAEKEAKRFLQKVKEYKENDNYIHEFWPCKERPALKRASMDLTRQLSEMRK